MPKNKRKTVFEANDVIGGRDVCKIQKLMKQSADETENSYDTIQIPKVEVESDSSDNELDIDFDKAPISTEDLGEAGTEFHRFFRKAGDRNEFISELQKKMCEAKERVDEEMSQFSGSIPGDLNDLQGVDDMEDLPEEMKNHIRLLGDLLRHYRSGPLPKTIKMLPHLPGWEGLLELLDPLEWTVHAYPRVVKVFASKGHEPALHFYEHCLLPRVKRDIQENRRLSVQMFEALIASIFRPEEFVSALFLPWIQSEMSKTEGVILSHLMQKASLKVRFAAVALALTVDEDFTVPRSLVVEALLSKRYHMPESALLRVLKYFLSFDRDCSVYFTTEQRMPVTWFKSLLTFLESYRSCIGPVERAQLVKLCRRHEHPQITPELRSVLALIPSTSD